MATANELFRDALIRRQIYLMHFSDELTSEIIKLLDETEVDVRDTLARRLEAIVATGDDHGPQTTARLKVLADSIAQIRAGAFDTATNMWNDQMQGLAETESNFIGEAFKDVSPVDVDLVLPEAHKLAAIVTAQPFQGKIMSDWASGLQEDDMDRIMTAVRIGLTQGNTVDEISRRVLGSASQAGGDGVLEMTRRNAQAITRTAISHVSNSARSAVFEANSDIFPMEAYVATLDGRTTEECMALDGEQFPVGEGPQPPIHWNCRSLRVAVISADGLKGMRPENSELSDDDIDGAVGQVPASTTYGEFLDRQTDAFQDHVLGPNRAELFRNGLTLDKFVVRSTGRLYTLDELRKREPAAFRRADL